MPQKCIFSIGSNQGDSLATITAAIKELEQTPGLDVDAVSSFYRTKPVGDENQPDFLNAAVRVQSTLTPLTLLRRTQAIEKKHGRLRDPSRPKGPRTLDIDLIVIDDLESHSAELTLPHPAAHLRGFVLVPWAEIDPEALLPQGRIIDLINQLDVSGIEKFPVNSPRRTLTKALMSKPMDVNMYNPVKGL